MSTKEQVQKLVELLGGRPNIQAALNCMTRLRVHLADPSHVQLDAIKELDGVLGVVSDNPTYLEIVVGPGKARKWADECADLGIPKTAPSGTSTHNSWEENKAAVASGQKQGRVKSMLKTFGEIFVPLIPGVVAAGICAGFGVMITQLVPGYATDPFWGVVWNLLGLVNASFLAYITAWAGYRAAERFGGTPILGGMLGMMTALPQIDKISAFLGLFDEAQPLNAILRAGRGGILAVVIGVWVLCQVEKRVRRAIPDSLDIVFTPLITLVICVIPYVLIIMPACGYISTALVWVVQQVCMNDNVIVRILGGYISAACFLPMVAMGMHHGLVALYSVQLESLGYVTLYPTLAMAGAGQVGAAIAIYLKAKKTKNQRMCSIIDGALPAGVLGIGEPLIYGVTLPMGKPFITAGLGAGFGGAFVMAMQVAATAWGPSGILAIPVMTAGPNPATTSMLFYAGGLVISYIAAFIITNILLKDEEVATA